MASSSHYASLTYTSLDADVYDTFSHPNATQPSEAERYVLADQWLASPVLIEDAPSQLMMYPEELYTGSGTLQGYPLSAYDPYHEKTPGALAFDSSYASDSDLES